MEEETRDKVWNRKPASRSHPGGIGRIVGTSKSTVNSFEAPKDVMEEKKKSWNSLFNKHSGEVSDEVEFGLETFETRENINEEDDDLLKQRLPMRKSPSVVQHWVNTGYLPYTTVTDQDKYSESGSSLSEEELSCLQNSPTKVEDLNKNKAKQKEDSNYSSSSVDTAAYILSNTNVTKKTETMPIVEGAKCPHSESSESIVAKNTRTVCLTTNIKLARVSNNSSQDTRGDNQILSSVNAPKGIIRRSERLKDTHRKEPVLSKCKELSCSDENEVVKENLISSSNVSSSNDAASITNLENTEDAEAVKNIPTNRQKEEIAAKHVEENTPIGTKYPAVRLERISPLEIKRYMSNRSTDEETVILPLRNTIRLNGRSVTNVQLPRKSLRSKYSSQPSSKAGNSRLLVSCQIQNGDEEDLDSKQSTVLLYECKNGASHECDSASESSSFMNNSSQDIVYNMANNSRHNHSSDESEENKNLEKWAQKNTSYVQAQIKTPEQEQANTFRKDISTGRCKEQGKNELSKEEILEKIKCIKAVVVLERLPQETLCSIRRHARNCSNEKEKSKTKDSSLEKPASIDTSTAQQTNDTSKTDIIKGEWRVETRVYHSEKFDRKRTIDPIKIAGPDVSELKRTENRKRHRSVAYVSSDEEAEFIKLLQNCRSTKRRRTKNDTNPSNVTVRNIVDTTDEESDIIANDDNPKSPSEKVGYTVDKAKRSWSQRKAGRSPAASGKKALERSKILCEYTSGSSDVSTGIFTSARVNRKAISPATISTRGTSSSPITVDNRISTTVRTPKKNNASPKRSFGEARKFEQSKRISEKKVRDSVTPRVSATCLRFQTRLFDSDSESLSVSSNGSLLLE